MKRGMLAGGILALAMVTGCGSSRTSERVVVAPPPRVLARREPVREVIVVERTHVPRGHAYGWWKQHGYREITVYSDGTRYYSRQVEPTGFHAVVVYQREGRYYLPDEDGDDKGKDRSHGHGHGHDKDHDKDD
jgi:hypothetical protein